MKKLVLVVFFGLLMWGKSEVWAQECVETNGDYDGNGSVDINDLIGWYTVYRGGYNNQADFNCDETVDVGDLVIWYIAYRSQGQANERFGVDLASFEKTEDVYPLPQGQLRFNKSVQMGVSDLLSADSKSSWTKQELSGGNKTQFIQTSLSYYMQKGDIDNWETQPEWVSINDINNLGFSNWNEVPVNYPIWSDALVGYDGQTHVKTGFAPGTFVFRGWRDVNGACILPGNQGNFKNYASGLVESQMVLGGAFGDATPAPTGKYFLPCDAYVWQEQEFEEFVKNNPGNSYIIYNEMNLRTGNGTDVMPPDLYIHHYKYYLNMILGYSGCESDGVVVPAHAGRDETAKIIIGVTPVQWTRLFGDGYQWYIDFYNDWKVQNENGSCTPKGPFQMEQGKIHTDGIPFWSYMNQPSTKEEVCAIFNQWKQETEEIMINIPVRLGQYFTNANPIVKEYGIHKAPQTLDKILDTYYYGSNFGQYDELNASATGLMTMWFNEYAIAKYSVEWVNWLQTYDFTNWKRSAGTVSLAIRKCNLPGNPYNCTETMKSNNGDQAFFDVDGGFATKVTEAFYKSIRRDYSMIDSSLNYCGMSFGN